MFIYIGIDCGNANGKKIMEETVNKQTEIFVSSILKKLKSTHEKFVDSDFGPSEKDEFGAISFYGNGPPEPAGSKYPKPEQLRWERPLYRDQLDTEKDVAEAQEEEDEFAISGDKDENEEVV